MNFKKHRYTLLSISITCLFAQTSIAQEIIEPKREKIGLVLSGGGARGLAHIGVLKALEEQHIPIDYIAGTSAGALIGGMYASGMSVADIEKKVSSLDLSAVAFDRPDRREFKQEARNLEYQSTNIIDLSITKKGELALPISVSNSAKIESVLRDLLKDQPYDTDFEHLPIPFNAVAADMATGKVVILKKGQLAQALRASMSIPAVFSPVEIDGKMLVDGMIDRNLPIDVVRSMGANRVIAIDVGSDLLKKEELNSVLTITEQLLAHLVQRNVDEQIATLTAHDVYIRPDLGKLANLDFKEGVQATQLGYKSLNTPEAQKKLSLLSVSPSTYKQLMSKHTPPKNQPTIIDFVRIQTYGLARPASLRQEIHMQDGQIFNIDTVNQDIARLMSAGRISGVTYRINKIGDSNELVYDVTEQDESRNAIRAGIEITSQSLADQQVTLHLSHHKVWINSLGGEWRNQLILGGKSIFHSELNQPLNSSGSIFIRPYLKAGYETRPAYSAQTDNKLTEYNIEHANTGFVLGKPIGRIGEWGMGLSYRNTRLKAKNTPLLSIENDQLKLFTLDTMLTFDQLDDIFIPTKGYLTRLYTKVSLNKNDNKRYFSAGLQTIAATNYNSHSVSASFEAGGQTNTGSIYLSPYTLGGYSRLQGYSNDQFIGDYMLYGNLTYRYSTPWRVLNKPLVIGSALEIGNVWDNRSNIDSTGLKYSLNLFGALRTPIGPAQLGIGFSREGKANIFFTLGHAFPNLK